MDLEEAREALFAQINALAGSESIPIDQAHGRVLSAAVTAQLPLPPFPASAMDGYAVRQQDISDHGTLQIVGQSLAGHPYTGPIEAGECARIFTGAVVPEGADLIVLQERVAEVLTDGDGYETVRFEPHEADESYIRPIGNDVQRGQLMAQPGDELSPLLLGALAAAGVSEISAYRRPKVGIFSSGDELRDPGTPPQALALGEIYDSNSFTVAGLLRQLPIELITLDRLPDDPDAVEKALAQASQSCDMLITSGGVSVGDADFIGATIARLGQLSFWRLNLKPGKPLAFGNIGDCWIFGLPGNPVSTIVTCMLLVLPSLKVLCGASPAPLLRIRATLTSPVSHRPGRAEYQRGIYSQNPQSTTAVSVRHTGDQGSNRLSTFAGANCLIEIPKDSGDLAAGADVCILPLSDLLC